MIKAENQKKRKPFTAQDTIPYKEIYKDGICRTDDNYYSKMVQFYDINYQLAQNDDKAAIFENYCEFLNSFDSSVGSLAVESIVGNSDFILMLNQHSGDQKILAEKLNISKHQISFVNNSNAGEGLLFYGNVIIPFADRYPQDTRTYALMSTKPDEIQT